MSGSLLTRRTLLAATLGALCAPRLSHGQAQRAGLGPSLGLVPVSQPGLVGWWKALPGLTGGDQFYDLSPSRIHGTLAGMGYSATSGWSATQRPGGYAQLNFDGTDDTVALGTAPAPLALSTNMTVMAWAYGTTFPGSRVTILGNQPGLAGYYFGVNSALIMFGWQSQTEYTSVFAISAGQWLHLGVTYSAAQVLFYVNGQLRDTQTSTNSSAVGTGALKLGALGNFTGLWQGALDDIRVYNRVLAPSEIAQVYQTSVGVDAPAMALLQGQGGPPLAGGSSGFLPWFGR